MLAPLSNWRSRNIPAQPLESTTISTIDRRTQRPTSATISESAERGIAARRSTADVHAIERGRMEMHVQAQRGVAALHEVECAGLCVVDRAQAQLELGKIDWSSAGFIDGVGTAILAQCRPSP